MTLFNLLNTVEVKMDGVVIHHRNKDEKLNIVFGMDANMNPAFERLDDTADNYTDAELFSMEVKSIKTDRDDLWIEVWGD